LNVSQNCPLSSVSFIASFPSGGGTRHSADVAESSSRQAYAPEEAGGGDECRSFWFPDGKIMSPSMRSAAVSLKDRQRRVRATSNAQRRARHRVGSSDQKATDLDGRLEDLADLDRHVARSPCHRAAYSPGPHQPGVSSPSAPAPAQASPSSTSRPSYRTTSGSRRRRVSETPARPGEAADGDSAGAVFQSMHMHRQVVAFSTPAIEQTPAAPGFAQTSRGVSTGGAAAPAAEAVATP